MITTTQYNPQVNDRGAGAYVAPTTTPVSTQNHTVVTSPTPTVTPVVKQTPTSIAVATPIPSVTPVQRVLSHTQEAVGGAVILAVAALTAVGVYLKKKKSGKELQMDTNHIV